VVTKAEPAISKEFFDFEFSLSKLLPLRPSVPAGPQREHAAPGGSRAREGATPGMKVLDPRSSPPPAARRGGYGWWPRHGRRFGVGAEHDRGLCGDSLLSGTGGDASRLGHLYTVSLLSSSARSSAPATYELLGTPRRARGVVAAVMAGRIFTM
jgi:hypothetical protein